METQAESLIKCNVHHSRDNFRSLNLDLGTSAAHVGQIMASVELGQAHWEVAAIVGSIQAQSWNRRDP